ncbi:hypothetical protein BABINDRAFT_36417 [Babjeviella inositovora NRRL Y-12698]|uniref:RRM domain-containing protein n=1 Tax=Babjeviella inositovora NRRL Y-12698 TaxID=984486 RepID=A0A1E3QS57_9ASCO|nr:uncharacterized protein BABINDRAFT_36417 [Babjeviella inositovora NRRL Y-12698]ODQ79862.1 hypothetical protein BABINDRAFT_36417 [Babjeviella inositovora NRRL Y-12698]
MSDTEIKQEIEQEVAIPTRDTRKPSTKSDDGLDRKTLFVRSVPFETTSEELSSFFSLFCPVKHAVIVKDEAQKSRGFGFVSFGEEEDTLIALTEAKKNKFKGRMLRVDVAKRRDRKAATDPEAVKPAKEVVEKRKARLIIRNLPWSVRSPDDLKKIFGRYGAVADAYIPRKDGGKMSGFGFVTMKKDVAAERAIKESVGLKIAGREVAVDFAIEKSKWETAIQEGKVAVPEIESEEEEESEASDDEDTEGNSDEDTSDMEDLDKLNDIENQDEDVEEQPEPAKPKENRQEAWSIFVRNVPYDATLESLVEHFEKFGTVKYALPVMDRETGLAKGTAFVAFKDEDAFVNCLENAPAGASTSMLIADDVSPLYVYEGRILSITSTVDRDSASRLTLKNTDKRKELLGKAPGAKDRRNLFLLNEGRITENSKLAELISATDLGLREKSYNMRVQQLNKNNTLHLSLTRLAIRNLPRAMNNRSLKALGRKAVVEFAKEVREGVRQTLSKEEVIRSTKAKYEFDGTDFNPKKLTEAQAKKSKKMGVVKQAVVIMEIKGSGEAGRSRGYGFIEFRDHKAALMGLRWLNAHEVSAEEILEGMSEEETKLAQLEGVSKRRLIAEFAVENSQVIKRRREKVYTSRNTGAAGAEAKRKREESEGQHQGRVGSDKKFKKDDNRGKKTGKHNNKRGNMNKGAPKGARPAKPESAKTGISEEQKKLIGIKRKRKQQKGK